MDSGKCSAGDWANDVGQNAPDISFYDTCTFFQNISGKCFFFNYMWLKMWETF